MVDCHSFVKTSRNAARRAKIGNTMHTQKFMGKWPHAEEARPIEPDNHPKVKVAALTALLTVCEANNPTLFVCQLVNYDVSDLEFLSQRRSGRGLGGSVRKDHSTRTPQSGRSEEHALCLSSFPQSITHPSTPDCNQVIPNIAVGEIPTTFGYSC